MKKNTSLLFFVALVVAFASCLDREKEGGPPIAVTQSGSAVPTGNYYPLAIGTKWIYDISGNNDTTTLVRDSLFAGRMYKYFKTGTSDYFIREENGVYYRREVNGLAIPDNTGTIERVELRTDYKVNEYWRDEYQLVTGGKVRYETAIISIDKERVVKGVKYPTVLHVRSRIYTKQDAAPEVIAATYDHFYGKNKGLIETISDLESRRLLSIGF